MAKLETGDFKVFAAAITANPESPDLTPYLVTLGLTGQERKDATAMFAKWNAVVRQPADSPIPNIVDRWAQAETANGRGLEIAAV